MRKKIIQFALCVLLLALSFPVEAQQVKKTPVIGALRPGSPPVPLFEAFVQGLRELGYVEGKNIVIEKRWAEGKPERLAPLAAELVGLRGSSLGFGDS